MNKLLNLALFIPLTVLATTWVVWPWRKQWKVWLGGLVIISSFALLYLKLGTLGMQFAYDQEVQQRQKIQNWLAHPKILIQQLEAHLQKHPESARGWFLLGRLYSSQNDPEHAQEAFRKANALK